MQVMAARRARRMEVEMSRYRDNQRASVNRILDGLGIDVPSDDVKVSLLISQAVKAKIRRDYAATHPEDPDAIQEEASAIRDLHTADLVLLAKIGMMDALSQLEYFKSNPLLGGGEKSQQRTCCLVNIVIFVDIERERQLNLMSSYSLLLPMYICIHQT